MPFQVEGCDKQFDTMTEMHEYHKSIQPWYEKAWDFVYYPIYRVYDTIRNAIGPRAIKHYYQRARYGYSYQDCWGIDYHLADIIPKMIRDMKENLHGCPGDIAEKWNVNENGDDMSMAMNEWEMILDKIANAFELEYEILDHKLFDCVDEEHENQMKGLMAGKGYFEGCRIMTAEERVARDEGWVYFRQYFGNLWD